MNWLVVAQIAVVVFMAYTAYEAARAFQLVPVRGSKRRRGSTYSPGESLWLVGSVWGMGIFLLLSF